MGERPQVFTTAASTEAREGGENEDNKAVGVFLEQNGMMGSEATQKQGKCGPSPTGNQPYTMGLSRGNKLGSWPSPHVSSSEVT